MESREEELEECIRRLLKSPELQSACEETRGAVAEATDVLYGAGDDELRQVRHAATYIGEQVEMIRIVLDQLCREFGEVKRAINALSREDRQKRLL